MATKMDPETSKALGKLEKSYALLASGTDKQIGVLQSKVDALTKTNGALEKRLAEIEKTLKGHLSLLKDHQGQIVRCNLEIAKLQGGK